MPQSKVFKGVVWASVQRFGTMIISFVTNIVLARLLTPDDFGTIGMLLLFLAVANTFVDSGFGSALIQKKDANETDFSTVFYINLGLSLVVYAILFLGAPWVARFYDVDILRPLLRAQGLVLILHAFIIIQTAILRKKMDFRKLSICNLIGNIVGSIIGIGAALMDYGVWSLVIRTLTVGLTTSLLLWFIGSWKPLLVFSKQSSKELFGFGGFMLLSSIVYSFTNNIQTLIMGKLFTPGVLGNYTQAHQLRNVATDSISSVIAQVLYPDFANNQNNDEELLARLLFSVRIISYIVIAIMFICILVASPLIQVLYGQKWLDCIPYFKILCVSGVFVALQDVNINIIAAKGKSKMLFYYNLCKIVAFMVLMYVGAKLGGVMGFIWGINSYTLLAWVVFAAVASYVLHSNLWKQLLIVSRNIIIAFIPFIIVLVLSKAIPQDLSNILTIIIDTTLFLLLLGILSYIIKDKVFCYLLDKNRHIVGL